MVARADTIGSAKLNDATTAASAPSG